MTTELIQIIIEHDGQLCHVAIPDDRKNLALHLLRSCFDDGVLSVRKLPDNWKKVRLSDVLE